ncbi:MAG: Secreted protein [uncultured Blastococcus sp.]|uniref:Secreted protein n=1 Tax=uncultured Blastococcus sp. TaxID=217144 RepID=A0A6J4IHG1_9ACTN|nr:MAG: Secreted protein [uncultured Blastococcus sp.]
MTTFLLVLLGVAIVAVTVAFLLRRRFLLSGLGAVTMWLRPVRSPRWSVGVAWYGGDTLLWYRGLSLAVRPHERLSRSELRVDSRRSAGRDDLALPADVVVLAISTPSGPRELAMDNSTVTGFLSWMESAPPGS